MGGDYRPRSIVVGTVSTGLADLAVGKRDRDSAHQFRRRAAYADRRDTRLGADAPTGAPRLGLRDAWPGRRTGRAFRAMVECGTCWMGDGRGHRGCVVAVAAAGFSRTLAGLGRAAAVVRRRRAQARQRCILGHYQRGRHETEFYAR